MSFPFRPIQVALANLKKFPSTLLKTWVCTSYFYSGVWSVLVINNTFSLQTTNILRCFEKEQLTKQASALSPLSHQYPYPQIYLIVIAPVFVYLCTVPSSLFGMWGRVSLVGSLALLPNIKSTSQVVGTAGILYFSFLLQILPVRRNLCWEINIS